MSSINLLSGTILPYLLGLLLVLGLTTFIVSLKLWRDTKRSPYFFMRQQAAKRMQAYLSVGLVLFVLAGAVATYGWQVPVDTAVHMAMLTNAKPVGPDVQELLAQPSEAEIKLAEAKAAATRAAQEATADRTVQAGGSVADLLLDANEAASFASILPSEYDRFDPQSPLKSTTELGAVALSNEVTDDYEAVNPANLFAEGFYTLYATFSYRDMADGMEWAWVWRHNGEVVDGGNELWQYGDEGPGYIYLNPEEGFQEGQYSLEIWVNGEVMGQAAATMNDAAVAAGN